MNDRRTIAKDELPGLLDRLACGELDEAARGDVLAWLEEDPARWRLCGLAFLEAQAWSQSLEQWPSPSAVPAAPPSAVAALPARHDRVPRTTAVRRLTVAATLAATFALGLVLRDVVMPRTPPNDKPLAEQHSTEKSAPVATGEKPQAAMNEGPLLAALEVRTGDSFGPMAPIRIPVVPAAFRSKDHPEIGHTAAIPDYVRQQWERRGYKVSLERRFLLARLPDGQQVAVPIDQVHVNPIPVSMN